MGGHRRPPKAYPTNKSRYGVARVHFQQCNYVLTDTQSFRDKMRGIAQVMKELEIDPAVGRTRWVRDRHTMLQPC